MRAVLRSGNMLARLFTHSLIFFIKFQCSLSTSLSFFFSIQSFSRGY